MKRFVLIMLTVFCLATPLVQAQGTTVDATSPGMVLDDPARGIKMTAPNGLWSVNGSQYSVSLNHNTYYDASVYLRKSYYTVATAQDAYNERKKSLGNYLPGAVYLKENEQLTLGSVQAVAMTYKNPSDLKVIREIMFVHKGVPYEMEFKSKEENFEKVKADFGAILTKMSLY